MHNLKPQSKKKEQQRVFSKLEQTWSLELNPFFDPTGTLKIKTGPPGPTVFSPPIGGNKPSQKKPRPANTHLGRSQSNWLTETLFWILCCVICLPLYTGGFTYDTSTSVSGKGFTFWDKDILNWNQCSSLLSEASVSSARDYSGWQQCLTPETILFATNHLKPLKGQDTA